MTFWGQGSCGSAGSASTAAAGVQAASWRRPPSRRPRPGGGRRRAELDARRVAPSRRAGADALSLLPSFLYFAHGSEGPGAALGLRADLRRRRVRPRPRRRRAGPPRLQRQELARHAGGRSARRHPAPRRPRGRREDLARRGLVALPRAPRRSLGRALRQGGPSSRSPSKTSSSPSPPRSTRRARAHRGGRRRGGHRERSPSSRSRRPRSTRGRRARATRGASRSRSGDVMLVVDVGGGTTDFSAIAAVERGRQARARAGRGRRSHPPRRRQHGPRARARGAPKARGRRARSVDRWQHVRAHPRVPRRQGAASSRRFARPPRRSRSPAAAPSSSAATLRAELTRDEVTRTLVDGFFPRGRRPTRGRRPRGPRGLTQLGLPYASDPAITRHLAAFLGRQARRTGELEGFTPRPAARPRTAPFLHPTAVLFNGGVMKADGPAGPPGRRRSTPGSPRTAPPRCACSRGPTSISPSPAARPPTASCGAARASASAAARRARTTSASRGPCPPCPGSSRPITALCVAPFGMEEGTEAELPAARARRRGGRAGRVPLLRLAACGATTRPATRSSDWKYDELEELPPIEVTLRPRARPRATWCPVRLHARASPSSDAAHRGRAGSPAGGATSAGGSSFSVRRNVLTAADDPRGAMPALLRRRHRSRHDQHGRRVRTRRAGRHEARVFEVPQLVGPGEVQARPLLPSLLYAARASPASARTTRSGDAPRGWWASSPDGGARDVPGRLVASRKSWLVPLRGGSHRRRSSRGARAEVDAQGLARRGRGARARARARAWDEQHPRRPARRAGGRAHGAGLVRRGRRAS